MSRLSENLAKWGVDATLYYQTDTACPCTTKRGSYSEQWHVDNPEPDDEDCGGTELIDRTETTKNLRVLCNDILALANSRLMASEYLDSIGKLKNIDLALIGSADLQGNYFDATSFNEQNSYWTINSVKYVNRRVLSQFSNVFEGDLFLVSRLE